MSLKTKLKLEILEKAFNKLHQFLSSIASQPSEIEQAAVIQAFKFTFELFWKTFTVHAEMEGLQVALPKASLAYAFQSGLIENEDAWLDMLIKRNLTVHTYNENEAKLIFNSVRTLFFAEFKNALTKLKKLT